MKTSSCEPMVEVTRGEIVESIHYGGFVVADSDGNVIASLGTPDMLTYPRSSMKPFQVLPFIERGGAEAYGFSDQEIAIMCASHSGTDAHVSVLKTMHEKIGITEADLKCGVHWPSDSKTRNAMRTAGEEPTPFRHNCSGKHTGMLAHALLRDLDKSSYLDPNHPVQVSIRQTLAEMLVMKAEQLPLGVDGCSAPVYGIPTSNMAKAVALLADPKKLDPRRVDACKRITTAMMTHPAMIAGPGKFDTELMTAAKGKVFSKGGAEGYQIIGVMPGARYEGSPGYGIAIKVSDGDAQGRARGFISLMLLDALAILDKSELAALDYQNKSLVKNWRGIVVGELRPAFALNIESFVS